MLSTTMNTRFLPGTTKYLRSDVPVCPTAEDIRWLLERNIRTVIDLREEQERRSKPCPLETHPAFCYRCMPVTGGNAIPATIEAVPESYIRMVDGQMEKIICAMEGAATNVLYFCNAGKDRTGVVSALLLHRMGVDRADIVADYMQSRDRLWPMLKDFPQRDIVMPREGNILRLLDWLETGGAQAVFRD